jgi:OFA family oxalate/formate antiporter-like MFS transporter
VKQHCLANVIQLRRRYNPTGDHRQPEPLDWRIAGGIVVMRGEPVFILMYFMFVIVGAAGLIVTANLSPIAKDLKVDAVSVSLLGMTLPALTFAATIDRVLNGLTRPFFGWISDNIGHENTRSAAAGTRSSILPPAPIFRSPFFRSRF